MSRRRHPEIKLIGCQIKSEAKLRKLARAIDIIEIELGVGPTWITLESCFICPDIVTSRVRRTPTQRLLAGLVDKLRAQQ